MKSAVIAVLLVFGLDLYPHLVDVCPPPAEPCPEISYQSSVQNPGFDSVSGAWTWFNDPRAVWIDGKTYFAAIDGRGHIKVAEYDNANNTTFITDLGFFESDDHDNAAIRLTRDKNIEIYYSRHVTGEYYRQRSVRPEDITAFCQPGRKSS